MLNEAISKLKTEMEESKNNDYIKVVGDFLINHLEANPGDAGKILISEKTISKSLDEMRKAAEKKQVNRCGMFTPQQGFEIVIKYFGIESTASGAATKVKIEKKDTPVSAVEEKKPAIDFDLSLDDYL